MVPPPRKDTALMDAEVREKIHLEILKRTGALVPRFINTMTRSGTTAVALTLIHVAACSTAITTPSPTRSSTTTSTRA
jgi:hypothetical protein